MDDFDVMNTTELAETTDLAEGTEIEVTDPVLDEGVGTFDELDTPTVEAAPEGHGKWIGLGIAVGAATVVAVTAAGKLVKKAYKWGKKKLDERKAKKEQERGEYQNPEPEADTEMTEPTADAAAPVEPVEFETKE